jgi:hypothetical protein
VGVGGAGVGIGVAHNEFQSGYAVRSVDPQLSYTPRLMQSERPTLSNAEKKVVTRSTFHAPMFALNAVAPLNACKPSHALSKSPRRMSPEPRRVSSVHRARSVQRAYRACGAMRGCSTVEMRRN